MTGHLVDTASRPSLHRRLESVARTRGFPVGGEALDRLLDYLTAVLEAGRHLNLTSAKTLERAVDVLGLSALAVTAAWTGSRPPRRIVDLGTGNGLPGVAAAIAWPEAQVLLIERRAKKARAVAACLETTGIANAEAVAADGRELIRLRPDVRGSIDLVTVRAVGPLADTTREAAPWLAPGGRVAHWKGAGLGKEEIAAGRAVARELRLQIAPPLRFEDEGGPAHLICYARREESP